MSSGFPGGGGPDFYAAGGISTRRSINNPQLPYRSPLSGVIPDPSTPMVHRAPDLIGKRSLAEFQHHQQQQQQQFQQHLGLAGIYNNLRNVKPRVNYQLASPISPLSPVDFSSISSLSPEISSISNASPLNPRYGLPILQQLRPQQAVNRFSTCPSTISFPDSVQNRELSGAQDQREKKMMNRLQELENELLKDDENECEAGDAVSAVTSSEWGDTIQNWNLMGPTTNIQKPISPSPSSSSSSCSSTSASPPITCPKNSMVEAATAIVEGRAEAAADILTRLFQVANARGTSEQRLTAYMAAALRSRLNPAEHSPPVAELYSKEHKLSTQMLYEVSPCFKLGFMAANLAILESISHAPVNMLHIIDFDIGQGGQYVHLLHALAAEKANKPAALKITAFSDNSYGGEDRLRAVGDGLKMLASKMGLRFKFSVVGFKISDFSREKLDIESEETLVVNFAFKLYKLPDESVTTENMRDELLRRVKGLSPVAVTVVEQEMNANTAPFVARVNEACGYYGVLFESLDATVAKDSSERVRIEEGLGRSMSNSVACEGRDRVERCEVFGKWRARMTMAGFEPRPMSPLVAESLRSKLNSGTRGNPGFTVNEQSGGMCFGWMGRTLAVSSAWR